jgi:hypothetical protein
MTGRRKNARYICAVPQEGELQVVYDVVLERRTEREVFVWSDAPQPRGQELTLDLGPSVSSDSFSARVLECETVIVDGSLRYRLRFAIGDPVKPGV